MNIEVIIWMLTITTSAVLSIITTIIVLMVRAITRGLVSLYNHVQLRYFMKMVMGNGWTKTKDEVLTQKTQPTNEGDS